MSAKPAVKQFVLVAYEDDVYRGLPMLIHVIRQGPDWYTAAACGKKGDHAMLWPFQKWIFEQSPLICQICYDKCWPAVFEDDIPSVERGR
jgi:hypothetical protein